MMTNRGFFRLSGIYFLVFGLLVYWGCTNKHGIYILHEGKSHAFISPSPDINIVKIDQTLMDIIPDGTWAGNLGKPKFSTVSLNPGVHVIVANILYFDIGAVFFLEADLKINHYYLIKYDVMHRIPGKNTWALNVWIEDATTGEKVSTILKNI